MKHNVRIICLFLVLVLFFSGCTSKGELVHQGEVYNIRRKGDRYYVHLYEGYNTPLKVEYIKTKVEFDDMAQMKQRILDGSFTYSEIKAITGYSFSNAEAWICNPYQLYEPYIPDTLYQLHQKGPIDFRGWQYTFTYSIAGSEECKFSIILPQIYSERIEGFADYEIIKKNATQIQWERIDPETGAHCLMVSEGNANRYYVSEVYETAEKKLYISYIYLIGSDETQLERATVYGEENGGYFQVVLEDFPNNIDTEYLSQFGITPYEGNEPPPKAIG